jgi:hypothetical protein
MRTFDRSRVPAEVQDERAADLARLEAKAIARWQDPLSLGNELESFCGFDGARSSNGLMKAEQTNDRDGRR